VITTPVGAIKTIVTDGETGLLIKPGSAEQLFQALDVMLSDGALASLLGGAARESVQDLYSANIVTTKYQALFQNLIGLMKVKTI
jgi:glycosyltransferase involved in cell wall biosynthesis